MPCILTLLQITKALDSQRDREKVRLLAQALISLQSSPLCVIDNCQQVSESLHGT